MDCIPEAEEVRQRAITLSKIKKARVALVKAVVGKIWEAIDRDPDNASSVTCDREFIMNVLMDKLIDIYGQDSDFKDAGRDIIIPITTFFSKKSYEVSIDKSVATNFQISWDSDTVSNDNSLTTDDTSAASDAPAANDTSAANDVSASTDASAANDTSAANDDSGSAPAVSSDASAASDSGAATASQISDQKSASDVSSA